MKIKKKKTKKKHVIFLSKTFKIPFLSLPVIHEGIIHTRGGNIFLFFKKILY